MYKLEIIFRKNFSSLIELLMMNINEIIYINIFNLYNIFILINDIIDVITYLVNCNCVRCAYQTVNRKFVN